MEMQTRSSRSLQAVFLLSLVVSVSALVAAPVGHDAEAIRLNNNGVALMNQQQTERAEAAFAQAFAKDKTLAEAALNDGIAVGGSAGASVVRRDCEGLAGLGDEGETGGPTACNLVEYAMMV